MEWHSFAVGMVVTRYTTQYFPAKSAMFRWRTTELRERKGSRASASFSKPIETAKANGLEPSKYLRYLFEKFPYAKTSEDVFNLLPMNVLETDLTKKFCFSII